MKIAVGFITYNDHTAKYLSYFLPSLKQSLEFSKDFFVLVVDNSDQDYLKNQQYIQNNFPEIKYYRAEKNLGYGRAYNLMIKQAKEAGADYFLVINPDVILDAEAVKLMVEALKKDYLGSVAPKILQWNFPQLDSTGKIDTLGIIMKSGLRFVDKGQGQKEGRVKERGTILGPSGACGLYSLKALEMVKENDQYFDEQFFLYKEDCDLAYRLFLAGFKSITVYEARVYHDRSLVAKNSKFLLAFQGRKKKGRFGKEQSFLNQHLLYIKYWKLQNGKNKCKIIFRAVSMFLFAVVKENFLLQQYKNLFKKV